MSDAHLPRGIATGHPESVVVHFDGACEPARGGGVATFGYVVEGVGLHHEESGLAVRPYSPHATNNVAEYVAAIRALEWLLRHGFAGEVVLSGDSQLLVRQMHGEYAVRADHLKAYHEHLRQLAARFRRAEFRWVPREENARADALTKQALAEAARDARRHRPETPVAVADENDDSARGADPSGD